MEKYQSSKFNVVGMDCEDEIVAVKEALFSVNGVVEVEPNLITCKINVKYEEGVDPTLLQKKIESAGLKVVNDSPKEKTPVGLNLSIHSWIVILSGCFLGFGLFLNSFRPELSYLVTASYIMSMLAGAVFVLPKAWRSAKSFSLDINVLMVVATLGAAAIGQLGESAAVIFLFSLAEWLESFSLQRARKSIQSLMKLVPETALVKMPDGRFLEVAIKEVQVGQTIRVQSGARIPLDGVVVSGKSTVNQAPITGESIPVEKTIADKVLAGTINGEGSLEVVVSQSYQNTKIAQIIKLIEEAQKQKAPTQRFVDKFAKYYTPTVFIFAIGVVLIPTVFFNGEFNDWFYRSLVLLVIACPCALVIATPVSIVSGLTAMARRGILVKGGASLEAIGSIQALAVDKTGTITQGVPRVLKIYSLNGRKEDEILRVAASIDSHSTHPLARAVVAEALSRGLVVDESVEYRSTSGKGAEATIHDHIFFVGNHRFAHDFAICSNELESMLASIEEQAQSVVVVGHRPHLSCRGEIFGVIAIGDAIRPEAADAIRMLHHAGIKKIVMLSGDNQRTVNAISKQVGIDEAYGELLPSDKVLKIKELKDRFRSVAMIGDGVNDAPAMATATIGIAMGASGTDTAIETSDVTLMKDQLGGIVEAIKTGRKTLRVIWFNTGFALATKMIFLVLSILGHSSLWLAIAADTGATLIVIANSLRLLKVEKS